MAEQILVTGAGGAQFTVDPSVPWVAAQLESGQLTRTGSSPPAGQPAAVESPPQRPAEADRKADWVAYIAAVTDLSKAEAEDLTKAELIDMAEQGG